LIPVLILEDRKYLQKESIVQFAPKTSARYRRDRIVRFFSRAKKEAGLHLRAAKNGIKIIPCLRDSLVRFLIFYCAMKFARFENKSELFQQVLATLALSMGTLSSGLAKGYTSPALDSILDNQPPHLYQSSNNDTW